MPFFVEVRGLKKIMTSPGRDRDWANTAVEITGLRENFVRDRTAGLKNPIGDPLRRGSFRNFQVSVYL